MKFSRKWPWVGVLSSRKKVVDSPLFGGGGLNEINPLSQCVLANPSKSTATHPRLLPSTQYDTWRFYCITSSNISGTIAYLCVRSRTHMLQCGFPRIHPHPHQHCCWPFLPPVCKDRVNLCAQLEAILSATNRPTLDHRTAYLKLTPCFTNLVLQLRIILIQRNTI